MVHPHASSDRAAVNMAHPRVSFLTVWLLAIPPSVQAEAEMKVYLRDLAFSSAREVEVTTNKKAIIITVRVLSNHARLACPRSVGPRGGHRLTIRAACCCVYPGAVPPAAEVPQIR